MAKLSDRKPGFLRGLQTKRVALVDEGANQHANIELFKRKEEANPSEVETAKGGEGMKCQKCQEEVADTVKAVDGVIKCPKCGAVVKKTADDPDVEARVKKLEEEREEAVKRAEAAETKVDEFMKRFAPAPSPDLTPEEIAKAAVEGITDENTKAVVFKIAKENAELKEKAAKSDKLVEDEVNKRLDREAVEKTAPMVAYLSADAEKLGPILRKVRAAVGDEDADEVERTLKAANAAIEAGDLFKSAGVNAGLSGEDEEKLDALVKQRAKADDISEAEAYSKVLESEEGSKLYSAIEKRKIEARGGQGGAS